MPIVSIILPYYRKINYIKKTINSILNQSFKDFEIILIYDDENLQDLYIIEENFKKNPKIKIIRDAEIEFFLQEIIVSISQNLKEEGKKFYPRLILNNEYNAFVTGSNKIYVSSGLINKAESISEIQGVIAHEIGHLILNHHTSRLINKDKK